MQDVRRTLLRRTQKLLRWHRVCVAPLRAHLQILLLTLAVMSYLVYKNKHRAKEFLASFLNYEGLLVVEVRERRDVTA